MELLLKGYFGYPNCLSGDQLEGKSLKSPDKSTKAQMSLDASHMIQMSEIILVGVVFPIKYIYNNLMFKNI